MKKSEVFVYIAGKYSDEDMLRTEKNVAEALELAIACAKADIPYFCPHTHSRLMDYYAPNVTWEYWMKCDFVIIEKLCNCMLMVPNWVNSKGAKMEEEKAKELEYPVFYTWDDFKAWYDALED